MTDRAPQRATSTNLTPTVCISFQKLLMTSKKEDLEYVLCVLRFSG